MLFPAFGSVDSDFGELAWLLDWMLGSALVMVEREEGCRRARQRVEWPTGGRDRMREDI